MSEILYAHVYRAVKKVAEIQQSNKQKWFNVVNKFSNKVPLS